MTEPMLHFSSFILLQNLHSLEHTVHIVGEIYISASLNDLNACREIKETVRKFSMLSMLNLATVQKPGQEKCVAEHEIISAEFAHL